MRDQCSIPWQVDIGFFVTMAVFAASMFVIAFIFFIVRILGNFVLSKLGKGKKNKKRKGKKSRKGSRKKSSLSKPLTEKSDNNIKKVGESNPEVVLQDNFEKERQEVVSSSVSSSDSDYKNMDGRKRNKSLIDTQIKALDKLNVKYKTKTVENNI